MEHIPHLFISPKLVSSNLGSTIHLHPLNKFLNHLITHQDPKHCQISTCMCGIKQHARFTYQLNDAIPITLMRLWSHRTSIHQLLNPLSPCFGSHNCQKLGISTLHCFVCEYPCVVKKNSQKDMFWIMEFWLQKYIKLSLTSRPGVNFKCEVEGSSLRWILKQVGLVAI